MIQYIENILKNNDYPGRGIITGLSKDGKYAVSAYFIMGRSENSRNRVFVDEGDDVVIYPFDDSKVEDPSLIIYSPIRKIGDKLIVTNGDQTDTVYDFIKDGKTFEEALKTRTFEPDRPNYTPRISAILDFSNGGYSYKQSILKSTDGEGRQCGRYTFDFEPEAGVGHFIHTYKCDGNPIPSFEGESERIYIEDDIDAFAEKIWTSLNEQNKVSLWVRYVGLDDGLCDSIIINKNVAEEE